MLPVPVLAFLHFGSVPVWAQIITCTGMLLCPYQYWHCCTLVQYQYGHSPLPILAFNCPSTGIGISAFWFSTSMGIVHYQYWHSITVPVLVLNLSAEIPIPVWAKLNASTSNGLCPYRYWINVQQCQYLYGHQFWMPVPVMVCANTSSEPRCRIANTSTGTSNECQFR